MTERKRITLEFFEQLNEPERSEAIENFDEGYSKHIPKNIQSALFYAFDIITESKWPPIYNKLCDNTYHTKQFDIEVLANEMFPTDYLDRKVVVEVYNKLKELGKIKE